MDCQSDNKFPLHEELSYWKAHVSAHDMLASELSYSLIYDNINPHKVDAALATVGLTVLPNRFFLIQVDDYQNYARKLRPYQEFYQKTSLVNLLRKCLRDMSLQGFAANLAGLNNLICFLCCAEQEESGINGYLLSVAEEFKKYVRKKSRYTISVCISKRCDRLVQYSKMYHGMNLALSKSYFAGKEFSILLEDVMEETGEKKARADLNDCHLELMTSVARHNGEFFERILQKILKILLESQINPQKVSLEIFRLIQRIEEYCIRCGAPENKMRACGEAAMSQILSCSFISDIRECFREYYEQAARTLEEHSTDEECSFKVLVEEYVALRYQENISLGDMAELLGFSEGHFARTFRKKFGITFVRYLTEYRIGQSQKLLAETRIPIKQMAERVGFNSYSYFCTCFKRVCGLSPGSYRDNALARQPD
jgi:AraC-like DNA-binding protein